MPNLTPMMGTPLINRHMSPMGSMASPQGLLMSPISPAEQQQTRRRPTIYEDRRRVEFDLSIVGPLMKLLTDGSSVVRYEAVMAFSNFVEKYMQAFLVIAEESTPRPADDGNHDNDGISNIVVSIPRGFNRDILDRFAACWKALRIVQHRDAHPSVAQAANTIVSVVHERLLDIRMEKEQEHSKEEKEVLTGIKEESDLDRSKPDLQLLETPHAKKAQSQNGSKSVGPLSRAKLHPSLRRTASEHGDSMRIDQRFEQRHVLLSPQGIPPIPDPTGDSQSRQSKKEYMLPKSKFYEWQKENFRSNYDDSDDEDVEDLDPLNPTGAARAYQGHRNATVQANGQKLANRFVILKPKAPRKKKELDLLLESDEEADEKDSSLKGELKLLEKKLLRNTGIKMTSMLKFHSFEDVLMVCDNEDAISIWDYEKGIRNLSYRNGNPKGSRMTTAFWINEASKSLFFVGSDDGSARLWNGIVESNGEISKRSPTLATAFFASPDMEAGQRGSGLICEWQQFSGSLIAGGNSDCIRCWDLATEQCPTVLETETDACVTALTTAWDTEVGDLPRSSYGIGPDVIVAGHSDGSLKVFDIRSSVNSVATIGGSRKRRHSRFTEHRSWIVDTYFTSYGGQFEILSGSVAGDIRAWDLRMSSSLRRLDVQRKTMTALSVHKRIPIAATGSHAQFIKILTLEGETLQVARFHETITGHRIGPVSCLEFHKEKLVLAAGATNSLVSIYKPKRSVE